MRNLANFSSRSQLTALSSMRSLIWYVLGAPIIRIHVCPEWIRAFVLKSFGATLGRSLTIRRGVRIHFPWNLEIGDNCWIGEEVWFINHEKVTIGSNVCISQRSIICSGGHDYRSASLEFAHKPIEIRDGAWICLDAKVLPGVTIGECSVVSAGEIVRKSLPDYSMLVGGQVRTIDPPK